jgi:hypothetical protein
MRHFRNPNVNTMLGGLGVSAVLLRELLAMDLFGLRHSLRDLVGSNVAEFNERLLHVGLMCGALAAFGNFGQ